MPKLSEYLFGSKPKAEKVSVLTPEQQALQNQLVGGLGAPTQSGLDFLSALLSGDPEALNAFEAPLIQQFEQETIPGLAERFAQYDAQGSSGFKNSLAGASKDLTTNLAALRGQLQMNALGNLGGLLGLGTQQSFQPLMKQGSQGLFGSALTGFGSSLGSKLGGGLF